MEKVVQCRCDDGNDWDEMQEQMIRVASFFPRGASHHLCGGEIWRARVNQTNTSTTNTKKVLEIHVGVLIANSKIFEKNLEANKLASCEI